MSDPTLKVSGFVLAGGKSTRMGEDKAFLDFWGQSLIQRVLDVVQSVSDDVGVIGDQARFSKLGVPVYADVVRDFGPLAGIQSALRHSKHAHVIVLGCDLPLVGQSLLELLISKVPEAAVVVPLNRDGQTEQLCAVYSQEALPVVEELIAKGIHTPRAIYERVRTAYVIWEHIRELPGARDFFLNVNTPAEYERAREILGLGRT